METALQREKEVASSGPKQKQISKLFKIFQEQGGSETDFVNMLEE